MHSGHTRRLSALLSQVTIALAVATAAGCYDDVGPYATGSGTAGKSGSGGNGTGRGGRGGASGTAGSTGSGGASGSGSVGGSGPGGSVGGSIGGTGTGGSVAGSDGGSTAGSGGSTGGTAGDGAGGTGPVTMQPWPSDETVVAVDGMNQFSKNLSDLVYEPPYAGASGDVLWGVMNSPSTLYCLLWNGTTWSGMAQDGWTFGKPLHYPGGAGNPDSEGLTRTEWSSTAIYVSTERDNNAGDVSRMSVLRYDFAGTDSALNATNEWNLTSDLPASDPNQGLEAVAWVPDAYLVAHGFFDEAAGAAYDPARYSNHGGGLFFVGLESNGMIYGYALDHSNAAGTFRRVATVASGHISIMSLDFDRDQGNLWAYCDDTCGNEAAVLRIGASGRFELTKLYSKPPSLANSNYEGITFAPESECSAQGFKSFFWTDDAVAGGHALFRGAIPCGPLP